LEEDYEGDHPFEPRKDSSFEKYSRRTSRRGKKINELVKALVSSTCQENKCLLGGKKLSRVKLDGRDLARFE